MEAVNSIKFRIPRPELESLRERVSQKGFQIWGDSGTTSFRGVHVKYIYSDSILTITVVRTSFVSVSYALGKIKEWTGLEPV